MRRSLQLCCALAAASVVSFWPGTHPAIRRYTGGFFENAYLIETPRGVANVESIAQAGGRLRALVFGGGDYQLDQIGRAHV